MLDAQALNFAYPGLLQPTRQEEPEPALPELGTPEYTAMQRRAHRLVQPVRPTTTLDHQAINDRVMVPHDGGGPFDSAH